MNKELYIVAVDGPAGAGKSTVCTDIAKELGILHLDTGATYRTFALGLIRLGIDVKNTDAVINNVDNVNIAINFDDGKQIMELEGENVNAYIRTNEISLAASDVAVIPEVREKMVELQRHTAKKISMVVDGRDICTYVFPDAKYKFYITAEVTERAKRRAAQLAEKGIESDLKKLEEEIELRDYNDMHRKMSPLKKADDAVLIDTTNMTQAEVVNRILSYINGINK